MKSSTIANAKNNLSQLIHQLEKDKAIQLTRYGKPVAVMMSESEFEKISSPDKNVFSAIQRWRSLLDNQTDSGFDNSELETIRKQSSGRDFTWEE